jgi:CHAD domain-containing protein
MALDHDQIQKPIRKLRKLLKKLPKQPTPEQVHDLRTNTRRLEAVVDAFALASTGKGKQLLKDLSRVRKRSGKIRDMDVLTSDAAGLKAEGEVDCKVQLIEHLGAERRRHAKKLDAIVRKFGPQLRQELKRTSRDLDDLTCADGNQDCDPADASAKAAAAAIKLEEELASPARLGRDNLHPYRLKIKELRNVLRLSGKKNNEFIETLGEVKDAIGDWHDWVELLAIANEILDHGSKCGLHELKRIADQKYQHALAVTESMRTRYLHVGRGKGKQQDRKPAEPVWMATRSMAA